MLMDLDYSEIKSAIDGLDHVASEMERKWGIGRLRLLVDDSLRARFDRQAQLVDKILWSDDQVRGEILNQIAAMRRAWLALDQAAIAAGHPPAPVSVIECPLPEGGVVAIASADDAPPCDGRWVAVYTPAEIGRMVAVMSDSLQVKAQFDGARVIRVRAKNRPLDDQVPTW